MCTVRGCSLPSRRCPALATAVSKPATWSLHVAELGPPDAPPLLLVHGWPQHWWCWRRVAPELAREHRCLMPDLRGLGWSDTPRDGYEKEQFASDMLALLDALGIERAGYVGHDWGGFSGLLLALRAPERLTGLLLVSIPHVWASRHDQRNPRRLAAFALPGAALDAGGGRAADARRPHRARAAFGVVARAPSPTTSSACTTT